MPGQNTLIVFGISLIIAFGAGWMVHRWKVSEQLLIAERASRVMERSGQGIADTSDKAQADIQTDLTRKANESEQKYQQATQALEDCHVSSVVVELLNDAELPTVARAASRARHDSKAAEASWSSCLKELDTARDNYARVCVPNQLQLEGLQGFYNGLKRQYNGE